MKKELLVIPYLLLLLLVAGCSLPTERAVTKDELYKTGIYNYYTIKESPESVLAALNRDGEVVLAAKYKDSEVYIRILATTQGLKLNLSER
jgi:hypothetical protein